MTTIGLILTALLFISGIPIWVAFSLGGIFLLLFGVNAPAVTIPIAFFNGVDSFTLMAITFFLLAGSIMAFCGPSKYIFDVVNSFFGRKRGGLAVTAVVMCMIYGAITGSGNATLAGVAEICRPEMLKKGYSKKFIASLLASSCTLGQMIPPSIIMIIYGSMVQQDTGILFISGIIPGILSGIVLCVLAWYNSPKVVETEAEDPESREHYTWKFRRRALLVGAPAYLMPVIVLGGIYGGVVTPTEAGGLAAVYSLIISYFYKKLNWKSLKAAMLSTARSNSMIFILIAAASLFANPLAYLGIPQALTKIIIDMGLDSMGLVLLMVALFLLLGMFMDVIPIMYLTIPMVYPALLATGVNLIHFNVILTLAMQIGMVSPPFGTALYVASGICDAPVGEVAMGSIKYLIAYTVILVIIVFVPGIATWLPSMMK